MELANIYTICTFLGKFGWKLATRFVVENEIFSIKIAIFIAEMAPGPSITPGAPRLCNSNHWKLPFEQFPQDFGQKNHLILGACLEFSLIL